MDICPTEYTRLVASIANKFRGVHEFEDLMQEGYIGLLEAKKRYDPTRGVKFLSYAYHYIRKYVRAAAYKNLGNTNTEVELQEEIHKATPKYDKYGSLGIKECLSTLNSNDQEIILKRAILGMTLQEIGNERTCTREYVRQLESKIKEKLKKKLLLRLGGF